MTDKTDAQEAQAASREDFMKRLFAVAVSVGFAAPLTRMHWIEHGTYPTEAEWHQIAILITALVATVGSWEGYFAAVNNRPLIGVPRFLVDILLVLIYMILLISSTDPSWFLPILVIIFILYAIWDILTVCEHRQYYHYKQPDEPLPAGSSVLSTYRRGLYSKCGEPPVRRGHVITLFWDVYFIALLGMWFYGSLNNIYTTCVFSAVGLMGYRATKRTYFTSTGDAKQKDNGSMLGYIVIVAALLASAFILSLVTKV